MRLKNDWWSLIHNANIISVKIPTSPGHDNISVSTFDEDNCIVGEVEITFLRSSYPEVVDKYVNLARESFEIFINILIDNSEFLNWSFLERIIVILNKSYFEKVIGSFKN